MKGNLLLYILVFAATVSTIAVGILYFNSDKLLTKKVTQIGNLIPQTGPVDPARDYSDLNNIPYYTNNIKFQGKTLSDTGNRYKWLTSDDFATVNEWFSQNILAYGWNCESIAPNNQADNSPKYSCKKGGLAFEVQIETADNQTNITLTLPKS